jgi:Flp pilus assembly protein TadD
MMQADHHQRSIQAFQRVIDEKLAADDPAPAHYYLAAAAAFSNQYELALTAARNARQARPDDFRFHQREAWVLHRAKRLAEAKEKYDSLLKQFDKSTDTRIRTELLQARRIVSQISLDLGDETAAVERLEEALDEFPDDAGALNDLGYVWADRGSHLQRSLRMVQRAVAAEPENKAFRDSLGWVYFRLGRFAEAVGELEKAATDEDPSGVILDHFGDALSKAGRSNDARSAWQKALDSFRKGGDERQAVAVQKKLAGE